MKVQLKSAVDENGCEDLRVDDLSSSDDERLHTIAQELDAHSGIIKKTDSFIERELRRSAQSSDLFRVTIRSGSAARRNSSMGDADAESLTLGR